MGEGKFKLLLVDDEEQFRQTLGKRLNEYGYDVEGVGTGMEALELLGKKPIDVVVLDIRMPGLSGIETLTEIRNKNIGVEVILLTGHSDVPSAVEGMRLGAFDYLMKPHDFQSLLAKIAEACSVKKTRDERIRLAELRAQLDYLKDAVRAAGV
jgi:DNA-binding NtrC family response regulator